jgi:hypothetical protein
VYAERRVDEALEGVCKERGCIDEGGAMFEKDRSEEL